MGHTILGIQMIDLMQTAKGCLNDGHIPIPPFIYNCVMLWLHSIIFYAMIRRTKQHAATLWVSLVVLGLRWGPPWPRMRDMLILDLDEVC